MVRGGISLIKRTRKATNQRNNLEFSGGINKRSSEGYAEKFIEKFGNSDTYSKFKDVAGGAGAGGFVVAQALVVLVVLHQPSGSFPVALRLREQVVQVVPAVRRWFNSGAGNVQGAVLSPL